MVNYDFKLSGLGNIALENSIRKAVEYANYSEQELSDIRESAHYSLLDVMCNLDNIKQKFLTLQQMASLMPDIVVSNSITSIKTLLKKIFAKIFRWYVVPMTVSQSCFNSEVLSLISCLVFSIQTQKETIKQLEKELNKMRKSNV
jgi:hypothetical protein